MENNNNNNGRGIFYGVIGVATLVVAIIGATFAYFTATVTRNNAITNVQSTSLDLNIINEQSNFRTDMIPVDAEDNGALFSTFPGISTAGANGTGCRDLVGNSICSVYQFTIENPNKTTAQVVTGSLKVVLNEFTHLQYALFKGSDTEILSTTAKYNVDADEAPTATSDDNWVTQTNANLGTLVEKGTFGSQGTIETWANTTEKLNKEGTTTYTMVIWLEEAGSANDTEQGKKFTASITFASESGSGVTGVLTAAAS